MSYYEIYLIFATIFLTGFLLGMLMQHWIDRALWLPATEND